MRALLTAVETGTSMSDGASKSSSSSSAGMMVAEEVSLKANIGPRVLLCGANGIRMWCCLFHSLLVKNCIPVSTYPLLPPCWMDQISSDPVEVKRKV